MDYIGMEEWTFGDWALLAGPLVIGMALWMVAPIVVWSQGDVRVSYYLAKSRKRTVLFFIGFFLTAIGLVTISLGGTSLLKYKIDESYDLRQAAIAEVYGLDLTDDQLTELSYPDAAPEAGEVIEYGSTSTSFVTEDDELGRNTITLAWVNDELRLFGSTDADVLGAELPRVE